MLIVRKVFLSAWLVCASGIVCAGDNDANEAGGYVANEILVKAKSGTPKAQMLEVQRAVGAKQLREFSRIGVRHWRLGQGLSVERALQILANPGHARFLEYAEPNYLFYASATT
jgi:hypothetical protein